MKPIEGFPWWLTGRGSACQCRRHRFSPWSGKIPRATEQRSRCATRAREQTLLSPCAATAEARTLKSRCSMSREARAPLLQSSPSSPQLEESPSSSRDPVQPNINPEQPAFPLVTENFAFLWFNTKEILLVTFIKVLGCMQIK